MGSGSFRKIRIILQVCRNVQVCGFWILESGGFRSVVSVLFVPFQPADDGVYVRRATAHGFHFVPAGAIFDFGNRGTTHCQIHQTASQLVFNCQPSRLDGSGKLRVLPLISIKCVFGYVQLSCDLNIVHSLSRAFPGAFRKTFVILQFRHFSVSILYSAKASRVYI